MINIEWSINQNMISMIKHVSNMMIKIWSILWFLKKSSDSARKLAGEDELQHCMHHLVIFGEDQQNGDLHFPVWFEFQFLASGNWT